MPLIKIEQYTLQQHIEIVEIHYQNELEYHRKIIMTGDAHFHIGGFVNFFWKMKLERLYR